jgi:DNA-binding response OmpR family regulator
MGETSALPRQRLSIVVMEESAPLRDFVHNALKGLPVEPVYAMQADEGLRNLCEVPSPAVAVVSASLPDRRADHLVRMVRESPVGREVPICVHGKVDPGEASTSLLRSGADAICPRSAGSGALRELVRMLGWTAAELVRPEPAPEPPVVLIEPDPDQAKVFRQTLRDRGHAVLWAQHAIAALRLCTPETGLVIAASELDDIDGPRLVGALKDRAPGLKVVLAGHSRKAADALAAGASDFLVKPVRAEHLAERLGPLLADRPVLGDLHLERPFAQALTDGPRPFGVMLDRNFALPVRRAAELLVNHPVLGERRVVELGQQRTIRREDGTTEAIARGTVLDAPLGRRLLTAGSALCDAEGRPTRSLAVAATDALLTELRAAAPFDLVRVERLLRDRPAAAGVLAALPQETRSRLKECFADLFDHLDAYGYAWELEATGRAGTLCHWLATALYAMLAAEEAIRMQGRHGGSGREQTEQRALVTAVGLGAFLHDIGCMDGAWGRPDAPDWEWTYPKHAAAGYAMLKHAPVFEAVKCIVRDHHFCGAWSSRYDAAVELVKLASDLDALTRRDGILVDGGQARISPEPYSLGEALLILSERAAAGHYTEQSLECFARPLQRCGA